MAKIARESRNLFDISTAVFGKYIDDNGVEQFSTASDALFKLNHSDFININPETDYVFVYNGSRLTADQRVAFCWYTDSKNFLYRDTYLTAPPLTEYQLSKTSPSNAKYLIINFYGYNNNARYMLNEDSTPLPYEPYGATIWEDCVPRVLKDGADTFTTLPAKIIADGNALLNYQVWGNVGGMGELTENLCIGELARANMNASGQIVYNSEFSMHFAQVTQGKTYSYKNSSTSVYGFFEAMPLVGSTSYNNQRIAATDTNVSFTAPITGYVAFRTSLNTQGMLNAGGTALPYVPNGYKLDISVSDGTNATTTPIYIGDEPLGKDEYVDYEAGKVYKKIGNLFNNIDFEYGVNLADTGATSENINYMVSDYVPVSEGTYTISENQNVVLSSSSIIRCCSYDENKAFIKLIFSNVRIGTGNFTNTFLIDPREKFIRCSFRKTDTEIVMNVGATALPYLQPTDPPVPLPEIPTVDGNTVIDYNGTPKPSSVTVAYRRWHEQQELIRKNGEWTTPNTQQLSALQSPLSFTPIDEDTEETEGGKEIK